MYQALVIGNGESRRSLNINDLRSDHTLIGCNAIHRDTLVDYLVCCDRRMVEECIENPMVRGTTVYVRDDWWRYYFKIRKHKNTKTVPALPYQGEKKQDQPVHWGSGPYAVLLGATLGFKKIKLLGFDLYPINHNKVNNMYKDTENYAKKEAQAVDYSFWVYQIDKVFKYFPDIEFYIFNKNEWEMPNSWKNKNNVHFKNISSIND